MLNDDKKPNQDKKAKAQKKEDVFVVATDRQNGMDVSISNSDYSEGSAMLRKCSKGVTEEIRITKDSWISRNLKRLAGVTDLDWSIGLTINNGPSNIRFVALPEKTAAHIKKAYEESAIGGVNPEEDKALKNLHDAAKKAIKSVDRRNQYAFSSAEISQIEQEASNVMRVAKTSSTKLPPLQ